MIHNAFRYKQQYRKETIIKWRQKKTKNTCNTNLQFINEKINDTIGENSTKSDEIIIREKGTINKRKAKNIVHLVAMSNNEGNQVNNRKGKELLQQVIYKYICKGCDKRNFWWESSCTWW